MQVFSHGQYIIGFPNATYSMMPVDKFTVSRQDWLRGGAWDHEDDFEEFTSSDLTCVLVRHSLGHWCGYVALPEKHPWSKKALSAISVTVYGGLKSMGPLENYSGTFLGFTCAEIGDLQPTMMKWKRETPASGTYRDFEFAKAEAEKLAAAIVAAIK